MGHFHYPIPLGCLCLSSPHQFTRAGPGQASDEDEDDAHYDDDDPPAKDVVGELGALHGPSLAALGRAVPPLHVLPVLPLLVAPGAPRQVQGEGGDG